MLCGVQNDTVATKKNGWETEVWRGCLACVLQVGQDGLQLLLVTAEARNALGQLVLRHGVAIVVGGELGLVQVREVRDVCLDLFGEGGPQLEFQGLRALLQLTQQLGGDGDVVAASQLKDLALVPEGRRHDNGLVAVHLVVLVDAPHAEHAGVLIGLVGAVIGRLMPVHDAAHKGGNEGRTSVSSCHGLGHGEHECHVGVDALLLQLLAGLDSLPGGGDLDVDAVQADALGGVHVHELVGLVERGLGVEAKMGVAFGRHAAGDDLHHLRAECDGQLVDHAREWAILCPGGVVSSHGGLDHVGVFGDLGGLEDERGVGGAVDRLVLLHQVDVACVRDDFGDLFQRLQLVGPGNEGGELHRVGVEGGV
mmetsp:Transcript_39524/g.112077  ORF Transcript_39524/g.112077 Transcript_39524/m.112077 type:complete len:366 (-) Transcript_39524:271-1368(-)